MIKPPAVTLDIVQWMLISWSIVNYMFIFLLQYSKIECVYVVQWVCTVGSHPVIQIA